MFTKKMRKAGCVAIIALSVLDSSAATGVAELDTKALLTDVRTLASPAFAGRATGSDGSRLAQEYITRRFEEIGLKRFGSSYGMPFAITAGDKFKAMVGGVAPGISKFFRRTAGGKAQPPALNLIGQISGSVHPERVIVVSAHYDHLGVRDGAVYPGADDNASGVAAMLAVAAHFKKHPPQNTIVFAAFDAEELGKRGSNAFVEAPPFPIGRVALNLNFDMVSRSDQHEIFAAGPRYTPALHDLVVEVAASSSVKTRFGHDREIAGAPPGDDWTGSSDHAPFHELGIPFLYFGVEDHADYHKPGDRFEKIDPVFFAEVARLLVAVADRLDQNLDRLKPARLTSSATAKNR